MGGGTLRSAQIQAENMLCAARMASARGRATKESAELRTTPNSLSRACIVPWLDPGDFHRDWTARCRHSAPGQRGVVQVRRTRIGPRQVGRESISALTVSLKKNVAPICGLAVVKAFRRSRETRTECCHCQARPRGQQTFGRNVFDRIANEFCGERSPARFAEKANASAARRRSRPVARRVLNTPAYEDNWF